MTIDRLIQCLERTKAESPQGGNTQVRIYLANEYIIRAYRINGVSEWFLGKQMFMLHSDELEREMVDIIEENNELIREAVE